MDLNVSTSKSDRWVLLANRGGAKLFRTNERLETLELVKEFPHPEGRMQDHEIVGDRQGRTYSSVTDRGGPGSVGNKSSHSKHGLDPREDAVEHLSRSFALQLSRVLQNGRARNQYEEVILIAEPHFLGRLKERLDDATADRVLCTISHNWMDLPEKDLRERVKEVVQRTLH